VTVTDIPPTPDDRPAWLRDIKPRPNHARYLEVLSRMTPEQKLRKVFELSAFTKALFRQGLREAFPHLSEEEFHKLYLERLELCHNRNW
jgi:hypothetical protein